MPKLTSLHEYERGTDGEPRFDQLKKVHVFAVNDRHELRALRRDIDVYGGAEGDLVFSVLQHTGAYGTDAILDLDGVKALRDFLTRFIDQANERRVKEGR